MTPTDALAPPGEPPLTVTPQVVLDTNIVLDWLVFRDPAVAGLAASVEQGRLSWIASAAMRAELAAVLATGLASRRPSDPSLVLQAWDRHVTVLPSPTANALRCRDPDDQMFVDLALGAPARWLVSRDRALLALRRRAAGLGLAIVHPLDWTMPE